MRQTLTSIVLALLLMMAAGCQNDKGSTNQVSGTGGTTAIQAEQAGNPISAPAEKPPSGTDSAKDTPSPAASANDVRMGKVTAVRIANPDTGWVGGEGWIARTDDGGKKWQVQYHGKGTISQLFALNDQQAWALVSGSSDQTVERSLLSTTDGGTHWTTAGKVPNQGFLHFVSNHEAFSANARTTDGGQTWTPIPVPDHTVGDAYFHDKDHGWAVTQGEDTVEVKRTTDGGLTWNTVMSRKSAAALHGALIRSAGADDAWVECIGDSGMTQTSYSLFHTTDGGKHWQTVIANSTAGGGPAPGFPAGAGESPKHTGPKPGALYVVDPKTAFMGGQCLACDKPNTIGWTMDGGKTWVNGKQAFEGYGEQLLAIADNRYGWWICTDQMEPSVMYTTSDGGQTWVRRHVFDRPEPVS